MATCATVAGDTGGAAKYEALAEDLKKKTFAIFWDDTQHALVNNRKNGQLNRQVTRYANMFAMMYGYLDEAKTADVKQHVLLNDSVQKITTPYMRFYELAALCEIGEHKYVVKEVLDYWGGMLDLGATSFWEQFDPAEKGRQHLAMYGRPYGRSLCHAWGASPLYLFGKYFLGVKPLTAGYEKYVIEPHLGGLEWIEGLVPTPKGEVGIRLTKNSLTVTPAGGQTIIRLKSKTKPLAKGASIKTLSSHLYEIRLNTEKPITIRYTIAE
jgi:hypothetical protein